MKDKIPVAVLAATGAVGQRFVSLLVRHPWFEPVVLTGSPRSAGKRYAEVVRWVIPGGIPEGLQETIVRPSDEPPGDVKLVFSALPAAVAGEIEPHLAAQGYAVCSNASALRMEPDVPLLIPEVNPEHLALIDLQRRQRGWQGFVVTSPNCSTTGLVFPLKALHQAFGVSRVHAVTMQAISGAGYPGVSALDILDNVIPYIAGEEAKIERETRKLLGACDQGRVSEAPIVVSAQANRVPVLDGHMAVFSVQLTGDPSLAQVQAALEGFDPPQVVRHLPSAPRHPLVLLHQQDRPQPRRDRDLGEGMAVSVGRLQVCPVLGYRMVSLVHNTLRGAAAGAILNAELLVSRGYVKV